MDWVCENIAESFKMFKQQITLILIDENIVDPAKQAIKIQIDVGIEGLQRLNHIHGMELMTFRQNENETTDEFVNRAPHKGSLCDFGEPELVERIIELIRVYSQ